MRPGRAKTRSSNAASIRRTKQYRCRCRGGHHARTHTAEVPQPGLDQQHPEALEEEEEAIFILREVAASFERPALLFPGGKDSSVVLHPAEKAFEQHLSGQQFSGQLPFPLLHVDTGHNFPEVFEFRDRRVADIGERLLVGSVEDSIRRGTVRYGCSTRSHPATATRPSRCWKPSKYKIRRPDRWRQA